MDTTLLVHKVTPGETIFRCFAADSFKCSSDRFLLVTHILPPENFVKYRRQFLFQTNTHRRSYYCTNSMTKGYYIMSRGRNIFFFFSQ